jgi:3-deoxy-7-phosphoheptulonate synthase
MTCTGMWNTFEVNDDQNAAGNQTRVRMRCRKASTLAAAGMPVAAVFASGNSSSEVGCKRRMLPGAAASEAVAGSVASKRPSSAITCTIGSMEGFVVSNPFRRRVSGRAAWQAVRRCGSVAPSSRVYYVERGAEVCVRLGDGCGAFGLRNSVSIGGRQVGSAPWSPSSWRQRPAHQLPVYPDKDQLALVEAGLRTLPGLVTPKSIRSLHEHLAAACHGEAFVIQGGDCAETFSSRTLEYNISLYHLLAAQAAILSSTGSKRRIVRIGRIAGQFAKPRSAPVDADGLPSFRGDIVHSAAPNGRARTPDPQRLLQAYRHASASLEHLRVLEHLHASPMESLRILSEKLAWDSVVDSNLVKAIQNLVQGIDEEIIVMSSTGRHVTSIDTNVIENVFTSHEALLLPYEEGLVRLADWSPSGNAHTLEHLNRDAGSPIDLLSAPQYYATSAHFLWIGERTRQIDGAHVEFLRGVSNPIGVKLSGNATLEQVFALAEILNPANTPGRLTLITRMGVDALQRKLPQLMAAVKRSGLAVVWMCDPMHANTQSVRDKNGNSFKTRDCEQVLDEMRLFFEITAAEGVPAGGIHLEMSGEAVTECLGGATRTAVHDLARAYHSACDPRLNYAQALMLTLALKDSLQWREALPNASSAVLSA